MFVVDKINELKVSFVTSTVAFVGQGRLTNILLVGPWSSG